MSRDGTGHDGRRRVCLSLQQLAAAAERLSGRVGKKRDAVDWLSLVEEAYDRLVETPFRARPLQARRRRQGDKRRLITIPEPVDHLIEEALLPVLNRTIDPLLSDSVHGYRQGRSTYTAAAALSSLLARGRVHLRFADVEDCFDSIDWERLAECVAVRLPGPIADVLNALVRAPLRFRVRVQPRSRGLPLGRPTSPVLANLFLVPLDESVLGSGAGYLRYGDDLVIAGAGADEADAALAAARAALHDLGLRINETKLRTVVYDGTPVTYLGHTVDGDGVFERVGKGRLGRMKATAAAAPPDRRAVATTLPNRRCQTLYVTESGVYLRVRAGCIVVRRGRETIREVALHRIDRVLVLAGVTVTSGFLTACISRDIPVLFYVQKGRAFGSLVAGTTPNPLRLRAQYDLHSSASRRLALARTIVLAKVEAVRRAFRRRRVAGDNARELSGIRDAVRSASGHESLVGQEGRLAKLYYRALRGWIAGDGFVFGRRTRRPPRDNVNSLLSFAYSLLFSEVQTTLLAHGLDPYPGLLHALRRGHPALASDLMEPYRILVADAFVLDLINRGSVAPDGFETGAADGVYMDRATRATVLERWERYLRRKRTASGTTYTARALVEGAVQGMLAVVMGDRDELPLPLGGKDLAALASGPPGVVAVEYGDARANWR